MNRFEVDKRHTDHVHAVCYILSRSDTGEWVAIIETLVQRCKDACIWLVEYLGSEQGHAYIKYVIPLVLLCNHSDTYMYTVSQVHNILCHISFSLHDLEYKNTVLSIH